MFQNYVAIAGIYILLILKSKLQSLAYIQDDLA
jgi:hypothetical protein